jgi:hypothetical protein
MGGLPEITSRGGWRRAGYRPKAACERCRSTKGLVVHHKDRDWKNNTDFSNLETLCRVCHVKEHAAEIAESQRREDVNTRRGASISKARAGNHYPETSKSVRAMWQGPSGEILRKSRRSKKNLKRLSTMATSLMNDPAHIEKRRQMRAARKAARS